MTDAEDLDDQHILFNAAFERIRARFKCKEVQWLSKDSCLDHLGMNFFQDDRGTYLSMENYIDAMVTRLGIDPEKGRHCDLPMTQPITDYTPLSETEAKWFQSATGMIGWLAGTGRPDVKLPHSRISAYMASPCRGTCVESGSSGGALLCTQQALVLVSAVRRGGILDPLQRFRSHR